MKKILPLIVFSLTIGLAIPLLSEYKQFYYILAVLFLGTLVFLIRGREPGIYDFLVLFIVFIPFHHFRLGTGKFFVRLTELAFIPLFLLWLTQLSLNKNLRPKTLFKEYLVLALFIILSSLSITKSLKPIISIYRTLTLTYIIVFSFIVSNIITEKKSLFSVIKVLLIVSGLTGILGILQSFFPSFSFFYKVSPHATLGPISVYRATGGWDNPNYFSLFLSVIMPITIVLLLSGRFKEKRFLKICLFLQILGLVSTYSRNGAISATAAFLFLLWFFRKKRLALTILVILVILISSIWISKDYLYENNPFLYAFFFRIPVEQVKENPQIIAGFRWDVWRANINMFLDNPFLGVGPFMAVENYWRYRPPKTIWPSEAEKIHPHNEYISLLSERGIFGCLLFIIFLIMLMRRGLRMFKNHENTQLGALSLGLTASVFNFFVAGFGEAIINDVAFWVVTGLLLATYKIMQNE